MLFVNKVQLPCFSSLFLLSLLNLLQDRIYNPHPPELSQSTSCQTACLSWSHEFESRCRQGTNNWYGMSEFLSGSLDSPILSHQHSNLSSAFKIKLVFHPHSASTVCLRQSILNFPSNIYVLSPTPLPNPPPFPFHPAHVLKWLTSLLKRYFGATVLLIGHRSKLSLTSLDYICIFEVLGRVNISGHWRP